MGQNLAFGTDSVFLDAAQGTGGWKRAGEDSQPNEVPLPGITERLSAIRYVNSNLIYAGSAAGEVYRLTRKGKNWTAKPIHASPLPRRWIWEIASLPGNPDTIVLVMSGFDSPHVWRGTVAPGGSASWADISGVAPTAVPNVPVNALCIDRHDVRLMYVGTDVGVFRTVDGGAHWAPFSDGLPNTAVYDLKLHDPARLLRAATHGRGLWERKLDVASLPDADLYLREQALATARMLPAPAPLRAPCEDSLRHIALGDELWWWMCADIKVDVPSPQTHEYQCPIAAVDYRFFETRLSHCQPRPGVVNRVYVQVHNRGIRCADSVTVKVLWTEAGPGHPPLPPDFWTAFPGEGALSHWKPISPVRTIPSLPPTRPAVLEWDWVWTGVGPFIPCLLVVIDSPSDPIPSGSKGLDISALVTQEKRIRLLDLHLYGPASWVLLRLSDSLGPQDARAGASS